jgi:hypothetical protein
MSQPSPDAVIAPWLSDAPGRTLWVIGETMPPLVADYLSEHAREVSRFQPQIEAIDWSAHSDACLLTTPLDSEAGLVLLGRLRNHLIPHILCFVREPLSDADLFSLSFKRGIRVSTQAGPLLSFTYALATYNHTRAWNNPKFWANPENWNKYWW